MAKAIYMLFRVLDEPRSVKFYDNAFGLKVADRYAFDSFTLVYLSNSEQSFEIELTINHGRTEPYDVTDQTPFWFRATASSASRAPLWCTWIRAENWR
jgi:lactoylglutathione lyase